VGRRGTLGVVGLERPALVTGRASRQRRPLNALAFSAHDDGWRGAERTTFESIRVISYDAGAAFYDQLSGRWSRLYIPTLLARAGIAVGHRVLDVATGTGEAAILAGARVAAGGKVIGIDVSWPMLDVAAAKVAQRPVALLQMDAQALAFKDESFDAVVCQLGLMFLPDAVRALREWTRVLRSRGHLAVCVWATPDRVPLFGILIEELSCHLPDQRDVLYQPSALADPDSLGRLLAGAGLKGVRVTRETRVHQFTSFEEYWHPFEAGGGRHGQLYMRLPASVRRTVRDTVRKRMQPFFVDGGLRIEADVFLAAGER
jgi:SAM-dependent methyltransferase